MDAVKFQYTHIFLTISLLLEAESISLAVPLGWPEPSIPQIFSSNRLLISLLPL